MRTKGTLAIHKKIVGNLYSQKKGKKEKKAERFRLRICRCDWHRKGDEKNKILLKDSIPEWKNDIPVN